MSNMGHSAVHYRPPHAMESRTKSEALGNRFKINNRSIFESETKAGNRTNNIPRQKKQMQCNNNNKRT